ncbi:MAG: plasmid stabilization protein [Desulfuromonas sp. SDB]|nr:MAG: plasmid stabilization protein [Desulfuromonas sp. SDB]
MKIIWSPLALNKASEIVDYINKDSPTAAEKWINEVFSKIDTLGKYPEIGRIVPEINESQFREIIYGNYRIVYHFEVNQVSILTILHVKQILPPDEIN